LTPHAPVRAVTGVELQSMAAAAAGATGARATLLDWTRSFLMREHADLGRDGHVCPFTSMGARLDTLRFGVSDAGGDDSQRVRDELRAAFNQFDAIPHPKKMGVYRAVLIAFPNCAGEDGVATLAHAQKSLRLTSFLKARMIGVFHDRADAPGLWNKDFRPLRAPVPIVAIRSLVAADAAFVMRHPLLAPAYLFNYPFEGPRRLVEHSLRRV
jgi:hypothetical protein